MMHFYNEKHPYVLIFDIEFDKGQLIQFAGFLFKNIDDEVYQLARSINTYVTDQVCYAFADYTAITNNFLNENGIPLEDAVALINDNFLKGINKEDLCIISHGLKNDRITLEKSGIDLTHLDNGRPIDGWCTFNNAKRILKRYDKLKLEELSTEAGFYLHNAHNAFNDALATVFVYGYLRKKEVELIRMKEKQSE